MNQNPSNLTPRAAQVLELAHKEAARLKFGYIGEECLLLGIMRLGQGVAWSVLEKMGVKPTDVLNQLEKLPTRGEQEGQIDPNLLAYTPRFKLILSLAEKERQTTDCQYLGTEHLLLGILRHGDGFGYSALKSLGVELEKTRQEIAEFLAIPQDAVKATVQAVRLLLATYIEFTSPIAKAKIKLEQLQQVNFGQTIQVDPKLSACLQVLSEDGKKVISLAALVKLSEALAASETAPAKT